MDNNHQKPRTSKIGNGRIVDSVEGTFSIENIYKIWQKKRRIRCKDFLLVVTFSKCCHVSPGFIAIYSKPFRIALKQSLPLQL